jgi:hypothetical protein
MRRNQWLKLIRQSITHPFCGVQTIWRTADTMTAMRFLATLLATCAPAFSADIAHNAACRAVHPCTTIAIEDVSVIDVAAATVLRHRTVIVDRERITTVGPASSTLPPKDARIVSGQDRFLIPGLWDTDVHLWYRENQLPVFVAFGVTGVQDSGGDFERVSAWRKAIESGDATGPHIVTSGPPVAGRETADRRLPVLLARTPVEARRAFDTLWDLETDFIEVQPELSRDAYFALAEMARHWNLRLTGPVPASISLGDAIEARQASVEDLAGVAKATATEPEALQMFERCAVYGVRLSPALTLWRRMAHIDDEQRMNSSSLRYVPAAIRGTWAKEQYGESAVSRAQAEHAYRLVELMRRTKVEILAGTHTGDPYTVPGATLHDELEQLVAAGLTPGEALDAATLAPARFLGWDHAMGTVEAGKIADLVLLGANPLENIGNTRKIAGVFTRGRYYSRKDLDAILDAVQ